MTPPPRALVVDDNAVNIELVRFILESDGWLVDGAEDARDALASIARVAPSLVLLDIQLPGMDGLSLARQLKAHPATASIPLVAFTAYAMSGDEARMLAAGCDGYIAKPIDVNRFAATVRSFLPRP